MYKNELHFPPSIHWCHEVSEVPSSAEGVMYTILLTKLIWQLRTSREYMECPWTWVVVFYTYVNMRAVLQIAEISKTLDLILSHAWQYTSLWRGGQTVAWQAVLCISNKESCTWGSPKTAVNSDKHHCLGYVQCALISSLRLDSQIWNFCLEFTWEHLLTRVVLEC